MRILESAHSAVSDNPGGTDGPWRNRSIAFIGRGHQKSTDRSWKYFRDVLFVCRVAEMKQGIVTARPPTALAASRVQVDLGGITVMPSVPSSARGAEMKLGGVTVPD
jgi:hypothetical protein